MTASVAWQLVFCPVEPQWCPTNSDDLSVSLTRLGLIGDQFGSDRLRTYVIGPRFLQYITFMGCAPAVEFTPQADSSFIHWTISPCLNDPRWLIDWQQAQPKCGHCRGRLSDWRSQLVSVESITDSSTLTCPACQSLNRLQDLDWRQGAGYARQFISVMNIYPREALPTDALLQGLQQQTGIAWQYFYSQTEQIK